MTADTRRSSSSIAEYREEAVKRQILERAAEAQISGNAKCLLIELARRSDRYGVTEVLNYRDLSGSVGIGLSTVHHSLNRLIDRGYVVRVERAKGGSRYQVVIDRDGA
jgi:DNA-binding MarR family transcriptional regulator